MITTRSAARKLLLEEIYYDSDPRYLLSKEYSKFKHMFPEREYEEQIGSLDANVDHPFLPMETMKEIMEYVDIRTLFNMSNCCKTLRAFVKYPVVVRTALMSSTASAKNMENIRDLLVAESIHTPSVHRLLRLMVGQKCEFCKEKVVDGVNRFYGVAICNHCVDSTDPKYVTVVTKAGESYFRKRRQIDYLLDDKNFITVREGFRTLRNNTLEHARAVRLDIPVQWLSHDHLQVEDLHNLLWNQKYCDNYGEKTGPLLCHSDFIFLCELLMTAHEDEWSRLLKRYVSRYIGASPTNDERRNDILNCYNNERSRADINDNKWQWKMQMSYIKVVTTKRVEAIRFVEKLRTYLDNPILSDEVLNYVSSSRFDNCYFRNNDGSVVPIEFGYRWMDDIMREPLNNMEKYGKRRFKSLANKIKKQAKKNLDPDVIHPDLRDFIVMSTPSAVNPYFGP